MPPLHRAGWETHQSKTKPGLSLQTIAAFAAIYILWGSTFLAIRIAVEKLPALFAAGVRFSIAGVVLYAWSRWRGAAPPAEREWRNLWLLGALMFLGAYSGLFWAEKTLPSGVASVLVATIPVWTLLLEVFILRNQTFRLTISAAIAMGFAGVLVIAIGGGAGAPGRNVNMLACLAILGSQISWSTGTVASKRMRLPESKSLSAGAQMMCGGALLLCSALLAGEMTPPPRIGSRAAIALAYLIVAGSLIAFTAYMWLLGRMSPTRVASYAYVNPVVALALGHWIGGEKITPSTLIGSGLVLAAVVLILTLGRRPRPG